MFGPTLVKLAYVDTHATCTLTTPPLVDLPVTGERSLDGPLCLVAKGNLWCYSVGATMITDDKWSCLLSLCRHVPPEAMA